MVQPVHPEQVELMVHPEQVEHLGLLAQLAQLAQLLIWKHLDII
jgi:hypothetical protein